ncbi:acyl-CoA ligase (AMP-forming), exosortase A system-associated [Actinokineospora sp. 24-640]
MSRVDALLRHGDPDRPALTHQGRTLTYGELAGETARAAAGLRAMGVRPGERVAVFAEKRLETVAALLAVSAAGAVAVPVNPLAKPAQVGHVLSDCAAAALVTTAARARALAATLAETRSVRALVLLDSDDGDARTVPWSRLVLSDEDDPVPVAETDPAAILYTSGSTGGPKGVVLSHRNLTVGARSVAGYLGHTADDVVLAVLPLSFDAGLSQLTTAFTAGAHAVLVNYLRPREVVALCARHRVTGLTGVPPLWLQLAGADWPPEAAGPLRYFASTGGRMPRTTLARLRALFPAARPYLMYGLTEAFRSTYLDPAEVDRRPDSVGKAIPDAEVLVVRPDGTECAPGEEGELVHRGPLVAQGYWNDPVRSAERFRPYPPDVPGAETAVWSGDRARRDEDGFVHIVGRTDEMIKTSGYRVSPSEVENAAYATGLVAEAAAFGVPDEALGQRIVLAVSGVEDTGPLRAALGRDLPGYMLPGTVLTRPALPRSGNGKFDLAALRRVAAR